MDARGHAELKLKAIIDDTTRAALREREPIVTEFVRSGALGGRMYHLIGQMVLGLHASALDQMLRFLHQTELVTEDKAHLFGLATTSLGNSLRQVLQVGGEAARGSIPAAENELLPAMAERVKVANGDLIHRFVGLDRVRDEGHHIAAIAASIATLVERLQADQSDEAKQIVAAATLAHQQATSAKSDPTLMRKGFDLLGGLVKKGLEAGMSEAGKAAARQLLEQLGM